MAKKLTIKQIAELSGVSAGTVDRVLHNRGKVSDDVLEKVKAVLDSNCYKSNVHTSAVSLKKKYRIVVALPNSEHDSYWSLIYKGVEQACEEYSDISIDLKFGLFKDLSAKSCREVFNTIPSLKPSGVIIGTTYIEETQVLCEKLDKMEVPYIFVDGNIDGTKPIGAFYADQSLCGSLLARLTLAFAHSNSEVAIYNPKRESGRISNNSLHRISAFKNYFKNFGLLPMLRELSFSPDDDRNHIKEIISEFLLSNPNVGSIAACTSTPDIIADTLWSMGRTDIHVSGFDITKNAERCIRNGSLDFVIDQHPVKQGYLAFEAMVHYLIYGSTGKNPQEILPSGVIFIENLQ